MNKDNSLYIAFKLALRSELQRLVSTIRYKTFRNESVEEYHETVDSCVSESVERLLVIYDIIVDDWKKWGKIKMEYLIGGKTTAKEIKEKGLLKTGYYIRVLKW